MQALKRWNAKLEIITKYLATIGFVIVFLLTFAQIVFRNIFGGGFAWIEEVSTLLLSAFAFFAISYSIRKRNYTFLDFFYQKCSVRIQKTLSLISYVIIILFLGYMFYSSIGFTQRQWRTVSSFLLIPRTFWYLSFPINCLIMFSFFVEEIALLWEADSEQKK